MEPNATAAASVRQPTAVSFHHPSAQKKIFLIRAEKDRPHGRIPAPDGGYLFAPARAAGSPAPSLSCRPALRETR
ncbi:hypothetical protein GCM10027074_27870 [Streptomyces deserti]